MGPPAASPWKARNPLLRPLVRILALLLALLAVPASAATPRIGVAAPLLRFGTTGEFVPVTVELVAEDAFEGALVVELDGGEAVTREVTVARGDKRRLTIDVPVPEYASNVVVTLLSPRGKQLAQERLPLRGGLAASSAVRVLVLGEEHFGLPLLREAHVGPVPAHPDVAPGSSREIRVETLLPGLLPPSWVGLESVDVLVWPRPDPAALSPDQQLALRAWVAAGGTLVVALGDNPAAWATSALAGLVPAQVQGIVPSAPALDALRAVAGPGATAEPGELPLAILHPLPFSRIALAAGDTNLVLAQQVGSGTVALLAFDPGSRVLVEGVDLEGLWRVLLGLWEPAADENGSATWDARAGLLGWLPDLRGTGCVDRMDHQAPQGTVLPALAELSQRDARARDRDRTRVQQCVERVDGLRRSGWISLREPVTRFAAAAPISLGFVTLFGLVYLLFIGPLDHLALRLLKRPMWTWLTFPALAVGFAVVASVLVSRGKQGGDELRCFEVVEHVPAADVALWASRCGLWSSRRRAVALSIPDGAGWVVPSRDGASDYDPWSSADAITGRERRSPQTPGRTGLSFEAAQWSASLLDSRWSSGGAGRAYVVDTPTGDGLRNATGADLVDSWLWNGRGWQAVGAVADGAVASIRFRDRPSLELAPRFGAELPQSPGGPAFGFGGRPHVDERILIGVTAGPLSPPRVEGITPQVDGVAVVRVHVEYQR